MHFLFESISFTLTKQRLSTKTTVSLADVAPSKDERSIVLY